VCIAAAWRTSENTKQGHKEEDDDGDKEEEEEEEEDGTCASLGSGIKRKADTTSTSSVLWRLLEEGGGNVIVVLGAAAVTAVAPAPAAGRSVEIGLGCTTATARVVSLNRCVTFGRFVRWIFPGCCVWECFREAEEEEE
jgi:hypothetical protein